MRPATNDDMNMLHPGPRTTVADEASERADAWAPYAARPRAKTTHQTAVGGHAAIGMKLARCVRDAYGETGLRDDETYVPSIKVAAYAARNGPWRLVIDIIKGGHRTPGDRQGVNRRKHDMNNRGPHRPPLLRAALAEPGLEGAEHDCARLRGLSRTCLSRTTYRRGS